MNLEHCRKEAKRLLRAVSGGDVQALARAEAVLGERAQSGFRLTDAQHVVALERGYRSWRELRAGAERELRDEDMVDTGLLYRPGEPVRLRVVRRPHRITVSDEGSALEHAGASAPWRELADRLERELNVNITSSGAVSLPVVRVGPGEDAIVRRIAHASRAFYRDLLDLE